PKEGGQATLTPSGLSLPSAVLADPGPTFGADSVLVTERSGLRAGQGNQLVQVPRSQLGITGC
ncbi:MAG TPA: hypothetical protein VM553_07050, partial [Dongiaceae bacterium]|nr:hypothetical protein [Dongiaceae bacterium]